MAVRLAAGGAPVVLVDINKAGLEETEQLINASGGECRVVEGDVTDEQALSAAFAGAAIWKGNLRILCNNAGIGTNPPFLGDLFGIPAGPGAGWPARLTST